jgi:hypothetical protein
VKPLEESLFGYRRGRARKVLFWIIFATLIISMFGSFPIIRVASLRVDSGNTAEKGTYPETSLSKEDSASARVVEHKITQSELDELKKEIGVCQNNFTYDKVINGHGTGLRPPTESEWTKIAEEALMVDGIFWTNSKTGAPSNVDYSTSPWFPPIGNQDGEGSCTTWAVGYYIKTFQEAKEHGWDLSGATWEGGYYGYPSLAYQNKIFSPDFIYHQIDDGSDYGSSFEDAIDLVCSIGACTWSEMPYDPTDSVTWPSEAAWREAPLYRGSSTGIEYINLNTTQGVESLKNWIASGNLAAIAVDGLQYLNLTNDDLWTLDNYVNPNTNHANTVVGYDDNFEYTELGETRHGAFKIANSWGIGGWGQTINDGCLWISYQAMNQRVKTAVFYRDKIAYEPKLVASFRIDHARRDDCDIALGLGDKSSPVLTKRLRVWYLHGGHLPFCSNNMVVDITEFANAVPTVIGQQFFLKVFDWGDYSNTNGTILDFAIEYYENYSSQVPQVLAISGDPPVDTVADDYVYSEVTLLPSVAIEHPSNGQYVNDSVSIVGTASQYRKQQVYAEDFNHEGSMPNGWAIKSTGPNVHPWTMELRTNCEKDYWAECSSNVLPTTNITEWLYMISGFDATAYSALDLEFFSHYRPNDGDEYAQVLYATSQSYPTFHMLENWTLPSSSAGGKHHHINLTAAAGDPEVRLAFIYHGTWDWDVQVDNIVVYGLRPLDEILAKIDGENWNVAVGTISWTLNWDTTSYPDGNHTITARAFYEAAYSESSISVAVCNNLVYISQFLVSDNRCNVGSTQTVSCRAVYAKNGSSLTEGAIWVNGTEYPTNDTGWCTFDVTSSNVEKNTWTVTGISCEGVQFYQITVPDPCIIFDKVNVSLTAEDSWIDVGSEASVNWTGVYAYDGSAFLGAITLNDSLTKNQVGRFEFRCASISDPQYGITAFYSNSVYCVWDRIKISNGGVTHSVTNITQEETVWFTIQYEYNGSTAFSGEIYINNTLALYSTLHDRWEYNCTLFSPQTLTFSVSKIVDKLYGLTDVHDTVGLLSITWHYFQILYAGETYVIPMATNSHISNVQFAASVKQIMFNVTGEEGTMGYCNITIPKTLLEADSLSDWKVFLDGYLPLPCVANENETHTFIYIYYTCSSHGIQIQGTWAITEFSPVTILLLVMLGSILIAVFKKYAKKTRP